MPKYKVLVSPNTLLPVLDKYKHLLIENDIEVITPPNFNEFLSEDELMPLVKDIDGAICGDDRYTEKVLKNAKKLKVLSKWGEGLDAIDLNAAKNLNILVCRALAWGGWVGGGWGWGVGVGGDISSFNQNPHSYQLRASRARTNKQGAATTRSQKTGGRKTMRGSTGIRQTPL